ncbi:hypothetical protein JTB14_017234 [Gonioctena quinquepunctata]|nr:hypothetical protein JTB14_017234 [Gonioctena quinquepunctata]
MTAALNDVQRGTPIAGAAEKKSSQTIHRKRSTKQNKIKKKLNEDKVPEVGSSKKYQEYIEDKLNAKKIQGEQKKHRAEERMLTEIEREKLQHEKKAARERKKELKPGTAENVSWKLMKNMYKRSYEIQVG